MSEKSEILFASQSQIQECLEHGQESEESMVPKEPSTSDDEAGPVTMRKRTKNFSDSESDLEKEPRKEEENITIEDVTSPTKFEDIVHFSSSSLKRTKKSRIKPIETSESENSSSEDVKTQKKSIRAENKMKKLKEKFRGLISNHAKSSQGTESLSDSNLHKSDVEGSEHSDEEVSCLKINEKIKKSVYSMNSICDPDTSDEESNPKPMLKQKIKQPEARRTKPISPKPMRMSAKQAMENMHKIKSESNRMLREKQVSLPYHRPKALSLKDILSRRKPAVTSDGKALPIKMNNEQLKQYSLLLEQRQKEVIELCKSDTEEEEDCPEDQAIVKNDISTDTTTNGLTELRLDGVNIQQIAEHTSGNFNEISCIETNAQENSVNLNSDLDKQTDSSMDTESVNDSANMDVDKEKTDVNNIPGNNMEHRVDIMLEYLSENLTVARKSDTNVSEKNTEQDSQKETASMDLEKENETEVTSNPRSDKEQRADIISEELYENQTDVSKQKSVRDCQSELANMDFIKETVVNNIPKSDKDQRPDIVSKELSETQIFNVSEQNTEQDSQNMELHYDSEKVALITESEDNKREENISEVPTTSKEKQTETLQSDDEEFLDNDFNYDEIDKLIENAKIASDDTQQYISNPKLTGAPGMVIDLDDTDSLTSKQLTGVDLLKERFSYFAKLKSLEDMEKDREKKFKPGIQHLKLKQELEEQIAEQRSNEWEKRLEEEKRLKSEIYDHYSDDDIEKLEAKLEEGSEKVDEEKLESESSEGEEEPIENDIILEDKPKKRNPMVDDEAEESECDEEIAGENDDETDVKMNEDEVDDGEEADLDYDDDTSDTSSESEDEIETKPRKGRILKAFEDSDEESAEVESTLKNKDVINEITEEITSQPVATSKNLENNLAIKDSQDDELQLAQANKSSEDLFSTQESDKPNLVVVALNKDSADNKSADLGTQTFSILDSLQANQTLDLESQEKTPVCRTQTIGDGLLVGVYPDNFIPTQNPSPQFSQTQEIGDDVVALCTGKFYDNPFLSQDKLEKNFSPLKLTESSQTQEFGDDIAALCTGKFYDNPFVSQYGGNSDINKPETLNTTEKPKEDATRTSNENNLVNSNIDKERELIPIHVEKTILNSVLEELDGPDFEEPKNKYFASDTQSNKNNVGYSQVKKKFVIDSDDETNDATSKKKNKKLRKRKAEDRALQISDDEDEEEELAEDLSDAESDINEDEERIVEYDSEENEVEVQQKASKKKRVGAFFENEAELTSEDEWVGSGDEDERGLDRMEREEGDDETFHQGQLQRELEQIHMREVLDQDKREVRMIQELLFEDGDLGDGHRQRKFRWRNAEGEEETGTNPDELLETQEEEFESEEQWRKQRHEREMFLRKLQEKDEEELDSSVSRTAIIKANLCSRNKSMVLSATKNNKIEKDDTETVSEKKSAKDIPSPKKPFMIFQQNYHGSLLTRGRGALARLAALATPLATDDDDAPKVVTTANRRNFVFTALSQDEQPKVTKRKAETNANTPRLIKKMKTEDPNKLKHYKNTLFDHLKS